MVALSLLSATQQEDTIWDKTGGESLYALCQPTQAPNCHNL